MKMFFEKGSNRKKLEKFLYNVVNPLSNFFWNFSFTAQWSKFFKKIIFWRENC